MYEQKVTKYFEIGNILSCFYFEKKGMRISSSIKLLVKVIFLCFLIFVVYSLNKLNVSISNFNSLLNYINSNNIISWKLIYDDRKDNYYYRWDFSKNDKYMKNFLKNTNIKEVLVRFDETWKKMITVVYKDQDKCFLFYKQNYYKTYEWDYDNWELLLKKYSNDLGIICEPFLY